MTTNTLTALKKSIKHWEDIASGKEDSIGGRSCALCALFNPDFVPSKEDFSCSGCPIREKTGMDFCIAPPYSDVLSHRDTWGFGSRQFLKAANEELKFLKSLLPKSTTKKVKRHAKPN